jgi:MFS family permease
VFVKKGFVMSKESVQRPLTRKRDPHLIHAWFIWLLSALFMFYKYTLEVSPSVMTSTLMSTFNISGTALGNLAACYFYAYLLLQIPAGVLLDKIGPRKVTSLAIALCALGSLIFANADSLWVAGIGRFITGAGAAFAAVNCLKLIANWFPMKQFAFMAGLMMTVAMLGAVGGQAPLAAFIDAMDWRHALEIIGIAGLVLAGIFWLVDCWLGARRNFLVRRSRYLAEPQKRAAYRFPKHLFFREFEKNLKEPSNMVAFDLQRFCICSCHDLRWVMGCFVYL